MTPKFIFNFFHFYPLTKFFNVLYYVLKGAGGADRATGYWHWHLFFNINLIIYIFGRGLTNLSFFYYYSQILHYFITLDTKTPHLKKMGRFVIKHGRGQYGLVSLNSGGVVMFFRYRTYLHVFTVRHFSLWKHFGISVWHFKSYNTVLFFLDLVMSKHI